MANPNGTLTPAYGRDYKTKKEILADWEAGKDFVLNTYNGGGYVNKTAYTAPYSITVRYKRNQNVTVIKVKA